MARALLLGRRDQLPAVKLRLVAAPRSIRKVSRSLVASTIASSSALVGKASETLLVAAELNELLGVVHKDGIPHLKSCLKYITKPFLSFFRSILNAESGVLGLVDFNGQFISADYLFEPGSFRQSGKPAGMALLQITPLEDSRKVQCTTVQDDQMELQVCVAGTIKEGPCRITDLKTGSGGGGGSDSLSNMFYIALGVCSVWVIAYVHDWLQKWSRRRALNASPTSDLRDSSWSSVISEASFTQAWKTSEKHTWKNKQKKRERNRAQLKFESASDCVGNQLESRTASVVDTEESLEKLGSRSLLDENKKQTLGGDKFNVDIKTSQTLGGNKTNSDNDTLQTFGSCKTNPDKDTLQTADSNRTNVNNESSEALQISNAGGNEVVHVIQEKRNHVDGHFKRRRRKKDKESKNGAEKGEESKNGAEKEKQRRKGHK